MTFSETKRSQLIFAYFCLFVLKHFRQIFADNGVGLQTFSFQNTTCVLLYYLCFYSFNKYRIGKQKCHAKQQKKKLATKRKNNAKIVAAYRASTAAANDDEVEETTELSGRSKHQMKVDSKRKIRQMLFNKKADRLAIKASTSGDDRSTRKALCAEIKCLKVNHALMIEHIILLNFHHKISLSLSLFHLFTISL